MVPAGSGGLVVGLVARVFRGVAIGGLGVDGKFVWLDVAAD